MSREIAEACPAIAIFAKVFAKVSALLRLRKSREAETLIIPYSPLVYDCNDRPQVTGYPSCG